VVRCQVLRDEALHEALVRQIAYSPAVLAVELPLGVMLALAMPAQGWKASAVAGDRVAAAAHSLERGWRRSGRSSRAPTSACWAPRCSNSLGIDYSYTRNATHAWLTVVLMDVWHWTLAGRALLGYAGLRLDS
jgi:glycerol transport system permease protein